MNGQSSAPTSQSLPPLTQLIRPEQILKLSNFNENLRSRYVQGVTGLWEKIHASSEDSVEHQNARRKLAEVTKNIGENMKKAALQAGTNGGRPGSQGQSAQQDGRPQVQQPVQPMQQSRPEQPVFSQKVLESVRQLQLVVPPNIALQGQEHASTWLKEAKQRYATQAQRYESATNALQELGQTVTQRQREGRSFSEQELQQLNARKTQLQGMCSNAKEYIAKFKAQQDQLKQAQARGAQGPMTQANSVDIQDSSTGGIEGATNAPPNRQQSAPDHQGQAHTVSSALDAARQQAGSAGRTTLSPTDHQPSHQPASHDSEPAVKKEPQPSQPPLNLNTSTGPPMQQNNSPQVGQPTSQQASASQGPRPLLHREAMAQAAQSYSTQPNYQQSTPQSSTHGHPQISSRGDTQNNNVKMPIPKDLKVPPPQPVTMGPARPTLTGGPSNGAMGQLGQPAIQKHPGYVLEGEGERVLSKKKLHELVRQVTGGGEDDENDGLTPDVEEVSYLSFNSICHYKYVELTLNRTRPSSKSPTTSWTTSSSLPAASQSCGTRPSWKSVICK